MFCSKPLCVVLGSLLISGSGWAAEVRVAVAANFASTFDKVAKDFAAETGHTAVSTSGSTGKFYSQITSGAPFDVLLAADDETPKRLEQEGWGVKGQRFTYAWGQLVLWSAKPGLVDAQGAVLKSGVFQRLALANPKVAPYGAAAIEVLKAMGLHESMMPRLVQGESVAQAYQFVSTGNAELGFVAWSQLVGQGASASGSWWVVPASLYSPLQQDALLLKKGDGNPAAVALMHYLRGDKARALIRASGYNTAP
ncbi:MAG: molybdate ABC transporter substrate-binding protein [Pseudomonadota bacterium]